MRVAGVIVEYNPMHNGHCYHLQKTIEKTSAEAVVAVMSGNFLQRGEPAMVHKWARAEMALQNGVDLVVELPIIYSTQSARLFAFGAVATMDALGVVTDLCFGSEKGTLSSLEDLADLMVTPPADLDLLLERQLKTGISYPAAYAKALREYLEQTGELDASPLNQPNNLLGLEYLRALKILQSSITPHTIQRVAAGYHDPELSHECIASATAIRKAITNQHSIENFLPASNLSILKREFQEGRGPVTWDSYTQALFVLLSRSSVEDLLRYNHMDEGLATRLKEYLPTASNVTNLIYKVKTRHYTWTRIQRALCSLLLGITKEKMESYRPEQGPDSLRILGFTEKGRNLLKRSRNVTTLPLVTNVSREVPAMIELNIAASHVYFQAFPDMKHRLYEPHIPVIYKST